MIFFLCPRTLNGIAAFLTSVGLCINFNKLVLVPLHVFTFLGVSIDFGRDSARVQDNALSCHYCGMAVVQAQSL